MAFTLYCLHHCLACCGQSLPLVYSLHKHRDYVLPCSCSVCSWGARNTYLWLGLPCSVVWFVHCAKMPRQGPKCDLCSTCLAMCPGVGLSSTWRTKFLLPQLYSQKIILGTVDCFCPRGNAFVFVHFYFSSSCTDRHQYVAY